MDSLYFITGNDHKYEEAASKITRKFPNLLIRRERVDLLEIQADSIEEVAAFKVDNAKGRVHGSFFIEDAGFFLEAFPGFPGVYSAYIHRMLGNKNILKLLEGNPNRNAWFEAVVGFYHAETDKAHLFKGVVKGIVAHKVRGAQGFGFDPIFIPEEDPTSTFGELNTTEKNRYSHRARALEKFMEFLVKLQE